MKLTSDDLLKIARTDKRCMKPIVDDHFQL